MNESRFAFTHRPFPAVPRIEHFVNVGNIETICRAAAAGVARGDGPLAVFGGAGAGKTMCCLKLQQMLSAGSEVILLSSSQIASRADLLKGLLYELKMPYKGLFDGDLRLSLIERLQHHRSGSAQQVVLVIDEAQALSPRILEELRLLTNITINNRPCLHLILCGSIRLEEMLCLPQLESLNQRICSRHFLQSLSVAECHRYIRQKIEFAGGEFSRTFDDWSIDAIHIVSAGIPRLIDQVADRALAIAASRVGSGTVQGNDVEQAWQQLQQAVPPSVETHEAGVVQSVVTQSVSDTPTIAMPSNVEATAEVKPVATTQKPKKSAKQRVAQIELQAELQTVAPEPFALAHEIDQQESQSVLSMEQVASESKTPSSDAAVGTSGNAKTNAWRGVPPSAGMGLSSVLTRDSASRSEDSEMQTAAELTSITADADVTEAAEEDLQPITVSYGSAVQQREMANQQAAKLEDSVSLEAELLEMISNINLSAIAIDDLQNDFSHGHYSAFDRNHQAYQSPKHTTAFGSFVDMTNETASLFQDFSDDDSASASEATYRNECEQISPTDELDKTQAAAMLQFQEDQSRDLLAQRLKDLERISQADRSAGGSMFNTDNEHFDIDGSLYDDRDIIVIDEHINNHTMQHAPHGKPVAKAMLQSYSTLFTKLRN